MSSRKTLAVLGLFASHRSLTAKEISALLDIPVPSVYRFLQPLVESGYLTATSDAHYRLDYGIVSLYHALESQRSLLTSSRAALRRVSDLTGATTVLQTVVGDHAVCLDYYSPRQQVQLVVSRGMNYPLHVGAGQIVLLSQMPLEDRKEIYATIVRNSGNATASADVDVIDKRVSMVRERGFDVSYGEFQPNVWACAVPVDTGVHGEIASLNTIGLGLAPTGHDLSLILDSLREGSALITHELLQ